MFLLWKRRTFIYIKCRTKLCICEGGFVLIFLATSMLMRLTSLLSLYILISCPRFRLPLSLCKVAGLQLNSEIIPTVVLNELASNLPPTLAEYKARLENRIEKKILIYLSDFQANIAVVIYTLSKSLPHCDLFNLNSHITD